MKYMTQYLFCQIFLIACLAGQARKPVSATAFTSPAPPIGMMCARTVAINMNALQNVPPNDAAESAVTQWVGYSRATATASRQDQRQAVVRRTFITKLHHPPGSPGARRTFAERHAKKYMRHFEGALRNL
jgi:hypothetical protein